MPSKNSLTIPFLARELVFNMELLLRPIKRALISVSDKEGIVDFAKALRSRNVEILSTGGTAKLLADNGVEVIEVSDYTTKTTDHTSHRRRGCGESQPHTGPPGVACQQLQGEK